MRSSPSCVGALYIVGVLFITGGYHVPRNSILAGLDPNSDEGTTYWATYQEEWVRMNHVRTIAPLVAAVLLVGLAPGGMRSPSFS